MVSGLFSRNLNSFQGENMLPFIEIVESALHLVVHNSQSLKKDFKERNKARGFPVSRLPVFEITGPTVILNI